MPTTLAWQNALNLSRLQFRSTRLLLRRLRDNAQQIALAYRTLADLTARREQVPAETEWLLDNYYIIDGAVTQAIEHLPSGYLRELPSDETGRPRVFSLASDIVSGGDGNISSGADRGTS